MGVSKTELFPSDLNHLARMAKALGHPARLAILEHLIKKGECMCGDIVDELPLSQSTVSQHLKAMKDAGIIRGNVDGPFRCYCVDTAACQNLLSRVKELFAGLTNCC